MKQSVLKLIAMYVAVGGLSLCVPAVAQYTPVQNLPSNEMAGQIGADVGQWQRFQGNANPDETGYKMSHEAQTLLAKYTRCLVGQEYPRSQLKKFLRLPSGNQNAEALKRNLIKEECIKNDTSQFLSLKMPEQALRAELFVAIYRKEFGKPLIDGIDQLPPLVVSDEFDMPVTDLPAEWRVRRAIGDCVVRDNPSAAHAFVLTLPWSKEEDLALPDVVKALPKCLPKGQTIKLPRAELRGMVGEAIYKLVLAQAASSSVKPVVGNKR